MRPPTGDTGIILFDAAADPLFVITMIGVRPEASVDAFLRRLDTIVRRGKPYALLLDYGHAEVSTRAVWEKYAAFMREHRAAIERYCVGSAIVVRDSKIRSSISAIAWMEPIRGPHAVCQDYAAAVQWLRERFRETGLPFPRVPQAQSETPATPA